MDNEKIERRTLMLEVRAKEEGEKKYIEGKAAVFNQETVIGSWFREVIKPGAFKRVLSEKPDVIAAYNHNWEVVLGRTTNGTLELWETEDGLNYRSEVNEKDPEAMSVYAKVERGDVPQASFAFTVRSEEWVSPPANSKELPLRSITEVDQLFDVGPCPFGAYPQASAQARSKASEFQQVTPDGGQEPVEESTPQEQVADLRRRFALAGE